MANVQLSDAVAAALNTKATALGLTVEAYLEHMLRSGWRRPAHRLSLEEMERLLDEEATTTPSPSGSFSRSDLYNDHD